MVDGSSGDVGMYTSIAVDSSDKVHISYYDWDNGDLKYTTNATGLWIAETVDSPGDVGAHTSIAIDSLDEVHISYYKFGQLNLKYANGTAGSWTIDTVDSPGEVGLYTSMAIDSSDNAHISYYHWDNSDLKYATNATGSWVDETVDSPGDVGSYTSIAVDSSDWMHISYYDWTNGDLKYATNKPPIYDPSPDVKANGLDGPVTITQTDTLTVTVELDVGAYDGEPGDWWVVAETSFGWYYYHLNSDSWKAGFVVTYKGPLFDLSPYEVLNMSGLPDGSYIFYFGVDMVMNGLLDMEDIHYDSVEVTVEP